MQTSCKAGQKLYTAEGSMLALQITPIYYAYRPTKNMDV